MKECKHPCCGEVCRKQKPPKARKRIKPVSRRRQKEALTYKEKRARFLLTHSTCQVKGCFRYATEVHHKCGRIGENYLDEDTWLAVCHDHHVEIELNPIWAKENGYSGSRLNKAS